LSRQEEEKEQARKRIARNAAQVSKYLEFRDPVVMKGTAGSFHQYEADRKSESTAPMSERGHRSGSDPKNIHFSKHVGHILNALREERIYLPARLLEHDPTAIRRWRAGETENDRRWMVRFRRLCKFVAIQVERRYPGTELTWNIEPEDEETKSLRAYSEKQRRWGTEESYRVLVKKVKETMKTEECGIEAAKGLVADRMDVSFARVHRAWLFGLAEEREERGA
jgi:hypothetical protein